APGGFQQSIQEDRTFVGRQLVDEVRGEDESRGWREANTSCSGAGSRAVDVELTVRPCRLTDSPGVHVESENAAAVHVCPRRAGGSRSAAEIDDGSARRGVAGRMQATGDGVDDQVVERAVEEREGGALAGRAERRAPREATAAPHVAGGPRPAGAPQLRPGEVGQATRLRGGQPTGEAR